VCVGMFSDWSLQKCMIAVRVASSFPLGTSSSPSRNSSTRRSRNNRASKLVARSPSKAGVVNQHIVCKKSQERMRVTKAASKCPQWNIERHLVARLDIGQGSIRWPSPAARKMPTPYAFSRVDFPEPGSPIMTTRRSALFFSMRFAGKRCSSSFSPLKESDT
jgi:hypothetical protein